MLQSRAGSKAEADFLRDVADGLYELVQMTAADAARAADPRLSTYLQAVLLRTCLRLP
jgi:hypothetical protein